MIGSVCVCARVFVACVCLRVCVFACVVCVCVSGSCCMVFVVLLTNHHLHGVKWVLSSS